MIKSDLRKMKYERQDAEHTDISDFHPPVTTKQHTHHKPPERSLQLSAPTPKKTHAKDRFYSSLSASYTSKDKDESTGESGYSDVESTITSGLSEVGSFSATAEVPQKQTSTKVKPRRPKEAATKDPMENSKGPVSGTYVQTSAPGKRTAGKTKVKQVGKKGTYIKCFSYEIVKYAVLRTEGIVTKKFGNQYANVLLGKLILVSNPWFGGSLLIRY
ncbi:hypothetical protein O3P69_010170 [Scylla paramamosain]|uniref:Uncharacterized protein n=1 Tax=Scylla paramamosain TaxID=85552 RepID=A0AAW0TTE7_SCYPA